jgi:uncharacterized membrane protein HdeD (DUF308 family)
MNIREHAHAPDPAALWWLGTLVGLATFGVGLFLVISPHETLSVLAVIAGVLLLVDGALAMVGALIGSSETRGLLAIVAVLSAIAGLVLVKQPFDTLVVLALVVGIWFVGAGLVRLVASFSMSGSKAVSLLGACAEVVAGILILSWPELGLATFAVILGIVMMLRGLLLTYAGWSLHRLGETPGQGPVTAATA